MYRVSFIYNGEFYSDIFRLAELNQICREAELMGDEIRILELIKI